MSTQTRPDFMSFSAYEEARDLPEAIRLNRAFMRNERAFCHKHFTSDDPEFPLSKCLEGWDEFEEALRTAERIWHQEMLATLPRIAERIRREVPNQENYGDIAACVESGDYSGMAC
jgi:hypothetical protein